MNRIHLYMRQVSLHGKTIIQLSNRTVSARLLDQLLPRVFEGVERIGKTCITSAKTAEDSFDSLIQLLDEILKVTKDTESERGIQLTTSTPEQNTTRIMDVKLKQRKGMGKKQCKEVNRTTRNNAQQPCNNTMKIPPYYRFLLFNSTRAIRSVADSFSKAFISSKLEVGFSEMLKNLTNKQRVADMNDADREVLLEDLNNNAEDLCRESFKLFVMSNTFYEVSKQYIMPRLSGLSLMLAAKTDNARNNLLQQLHANKTLVQNQVKALISQQKTYYLQRVHNLRPNWNEQNNTQISYGNQLDRAERMKALFANANNNEV